MKNLVIKQEKRLGSNNRINILGANIDVLSNKDTISLVEKYVITKTPLHLMGVNADKINALNNNRAFYNQVSQILLAN